MEIGSMICPAPPARIVCEAVAWDAYTVTVALGKQVTFQRRSAGSVTRMQEADLNVPGAPFNTIMERRLLMRQGGGAFD